MFNLYGNGKLIEKANTKSECKELKKDYVEIAKAIFGKCNIKFEIMEEV